MAHHKETTGSIRTMRRTLMGGAVVSSLLIASLAPASAGCLNYGTLQYDPQVTYQQSLPQTQTLPRSTQGPGNGARIRWALTPDFRLRSQFGHDTERPEPQANRGGRETFGGRSREGITFDSPRFGSVVVPQSQIRYRNEFGGMGTEGNQNLLWGQGLNSFQPNVNRSNQVSRVNVRGYAPNGLSKIPLLGAFRDRTAANTRSYRRELIINVTPRIIPVNER